MEAIKIDLGRKVYEFVPSETYTIKDWSLFYQLLSSKNFSKYNYDTLLFCCENPKRIKRVHKLEDKIEMKCADGSSLNSFAKKIKDKLNNGEKNGKRYVIGIDALDNWIQTNEFSFVYNTITYLIRTVSESEHILLLYLDKKTVEEKQYHLLTSRRQVY